MRKVLHRLIKVALAELEGINFGGGNTDNTLFKPLLLLLPPHGFGAFVWNFSLVYRTFSASLYFLQCTVRCTWYTSLSFV